MKSGQNMWPVPLGTNSAYTQVGHLVFFKTGMSKKYSIVKNSALGLLAHSVRLLILAFVQITQYMKSIVHQYFFSYGSKQFRRLEFEGASAVMNCVLYVPIPVLNRMTHLSRVAENWTTHHPPPSPTAKGSNTDDPPLMGSWKLNDPPLTAKGSNTDDSPLTGSWKLNDPPPPPSLQRAQTLMTHPSWVAENLNTHPSLQRSLKLMSDPISAPADPQCI